MTCLQQCGPQDRRGVIIRLRAGTHQARIQSWTYFLSADRSFSKCVPANEILAALPSRGCSTDICATSFSAVTISRILRPSITAVTCVDHGPSSAIARPDTLVYAERQEIISLKFRASVRLVAYPPTAGRDIEDTAGMTPSNGSSINPPRRAGIGVVIEGFFCVGSHITPCNGPNIIADSSVQNCSGQDLPQPLDWSDPAFPCTSSEYSPSILSAAGMLIEIVSFACCADTLTFHASLPAGEYSEHV